MSDKTTIQEMYDELNEDEDVGDKINDLLCDVVTTIIQVPGIREAVVIHVLNKQIDLEETGIHDTPFQYLWELLFDKPLQDMNS